MPGTDRVQVVKRESAALGGNAADDLPFEAPIDPQQDAIECAGVYLQDATNRDQNVYIDRSGDDLRFKDVTNPIVLLRELSKWTSFVEVTADATTTSTAFVDLLSLTVNKRLAISDLVVSATFSASQSSSNNQVLFRIMVDGTAKRGANVGTLGSGALIVRVAGLAVGSRAVKLQYRVSIGGTARVRPVTIPEGEHASLSVMEVAA